MITFHWYPGGTGTVRGAQMASRLGPGCDGDAAGVHVYVKIQPPENCPPRSYLDVVDAPERLPWLRAHPRVGVIACSASEEAYLRAALGWRDIVFIPQHHCNFERVQNAPGKIRKAGVAGGRGALQCNTRLLRRILDGLGIEFEWYRSYRDREDVANFYAGLDLQIVWRTEQRPMKNPLKVVNAMSFGIPTIAYPEVAFGEVEGYYWPATDLRELPAIINRLQEGFDDQRLLAKAEEYHIDRIAKLYEALL